MNRYEFMTAEQAKKQWFCPLTTAFNLNNIDEKRTAGKILAELKATGVPAVLVGKPKQAEIWRKRPRQSDLSGQKLREIWNRL
jgi:hypothetical protein